MTWHCVIFRERIELHAERGFARRRLEYINLKKYYLMFDAVCIFRGGFNNTAWLDVVRVLLSLLAARFL